LGTIFSIAHVTVAVRNLAFFSSERLKAPVWRITRWGSKTKPHLNESRCIVVSVLHLQRFRANFDFPACAEDPLWRIASRLQCNPRWIDPSPFSRIRMNS
jgi:hypothetical protein